MMTTCSKCKELGITTVQGVSYRLFACNGERLWAAFNDNKPPYAVIQAPLKNVLKILFGLPQNWTDSVLRDAHKLFSTTAQQVQL